MGTNEKNTKVCQCGGHMAHFLEFLDTTNIWGTNKAKNLTHISMAVSTNETNANLGQKTSCGGHVTQFWNFGTP